MISRNHINSLVGLKTWQEKEKMLVTNISPFPTMFSKGLFLSIFKTLSQKFNFWIAEHNNKIRIKQTTTKTWTCK